MAYTGSNPGLANNTGTVDALFYEKWTGEVMAIFQAINKFMSRNSVRTIPNGKQADFDALGDTEAVYFVPGTDLTDDHIDHNRVTIYIDGVLISRVFVNELDELKNHYDIRAPYSKRLGSALAKTADINILATGIAAARKATAIVSGGTVGSRVTEAGAKTDGEALAAAIFAAAQLLSEKDVPEEGRFCAIRPAQYSLLAQTTKVINKDWGGAGVYADGTVLKIAGVELVKTNNLPITDRSGESETSIKNDPFGDGGVGYAADFSTTAALVMHPDAVGTVKLMDLKMENDYEIRKQGTLFLAKYAMGHGIVRPECAVEIITS